MEAATWHETTLRLLAASAIEAGIELGVLGQLDSAASAGEPVSARLVATRCGLDLREALLILDALVGCGVVALDDGGYRSLVDPGVVAMAVKSARSVLPMLRGAGPAQRVDLAEQAAALYPDVVALLADLVAPTAAWVADLLAASAVATGAATTVLEVAAGQAPYGRACSARGMEVTALDLPPVIDRLRSAESTESAGDGAARLRLVAGNVFDVDLRDRYDAVIVAGFCRLHGAEANQRLFERCRSWLQPGGRLVVVDAVASPDATRRGLGLYALGLATRTGSGRVHGVEDYRSWFARAGCGPVRVHEMDRPELTVMWATRSAEAHREG